MVFFGIKLKRTLENEELIRQFNKNLIDRDIASLMFNNESFIDFSSNDIVTIYLKPLFPREIFYYATVLILGIIFLFKTYFLFYLLGVVWTLFFCVKLFYFLLLKKGLRKLGCKDDIKLI